MKRENLLLCVATLLLFLLPGLATWAQAQDQPSLGDVARKKSAARARRVVTNDEIPPSPEANNPPSAPAAGPSAAGAAANPDATAQKHDAAKSDSAPDKPPKLQELMADRELLQKTLKKMQEKISETNDEQRQATLNEVVKHTQEALVENQKDIDQLRAGGPAAENPPAANPPAADKSPGDQQPPK